MGIKQATGQDFRVRLAGFRRGEHVLGGQFTPIELVDLHHGYSTVVFDRQHDGLSWLDTNLRNLAEVTPYRILHIMPVKALIFLELPGPGLILSSIEEGNSTFPLPRHRLGTEGDVLVKVRD